MDIDLYREFSTHESQIARKQRNVKQPNSQPLWKSITDFVLKWKFIYKKLNNKESWRGGHTNLHGKGNRKDLIGGLVVGGLAVRGISEESKGRNSCRNNWNLGSILRTRWKSSAKTPSNEGHGAWMVHLI